MIWLAYGKAPRNNEELIPILNVQLFIPVS